MHLFMSSFTFSNCHSSNVLYPRALFCKSATGCLVHHYSQFDGNYTLENLYGQFDGNYTLENLYGQFDGNYMFFKLMGKDGGTRAFFQILVRTSIIGSASL